MRLFVDQFSVQVFIEESRKLQESVFREEHNAILQVFVKLDREYIHNNRIKVPVYIIIPIIPYSINDYIIMHLQILGIVCPNTVGVSDRAGRLMLAAWRPLDVSVVVM